MSYTVGQANPINPSDQFSLVTPSDTVDLSYHGTTAKCRAILVGTAGNVAVLDDQGTSVTIPLAAQVLHPISTNRILLTGTTAVTIIAFY